MRISNAVSVTVIIRQGPAMKHSEVVCWELEPGVFIAYPECDQGFNLLVCLSCGQVHSASVPLAMYIGPEIGEKIRRDGVCCDNCDGELDGNWAHYPETRVESDGSIAKTERPWEIPPLSKSVTRRFPEIYS